MRPAEIDEDDGAWAEGLETWRNAVRRLTGNRIERLTGNRIERLTGNRIEVLEVSAGEAATRVAGRTNCGRRSAGRAGSSTALASMSSEASAMGRPARTKPVSAAQVRSYAAKAEEFAEYEPDDIAPAVAAKAAERAHRCATVARRVASTAR